jgi:hypothetical protein
MTEASGEHGQGTLGRQKAAGTARCWTVEHHLALALIQSLLRQRSVAHAIR